MIRILLAPAVVVLALAGMAARLGVAPQADREICITVDDLPWVSPVPEPVEAVEHQTRALLAGLTRHDVPAIGFVNERKLQRGDEIDEAQVRLLRLWVDAGLELGNHTFSHVDLHTTPLEVYEKDVVRGERVTTELLGKRPRYFRHPMLHTGRSLETKRAFERFLADRGYRVAPVTMDNYDFIFAAAYARAPLDQRPKIITAYVDYMTAIVAYYEQQSRAILGREVRQILLLHANALNADAIGVLLQMLQRRGYTFIDLDRALRDRAYQSKDTYTGPGGITWLHRWAITAGQPKTIFAGEPVVPAWIERAAAGR